jgi:hypothetical protein
LYYQDEYLYSALARSFAATGLPRLRGSAVAFTPVLGPLLMAPAWLIGNVEVAYRVSQAEGSIAFAVAAFPAYALARRVGVSERGALAVALLTVLVPDGIYSALMLSEPYAYPLFLAVVLVCVDAMVAPTVRRQLAVVAGSFGLCLVRMQFVVVPLAYLAASLFTAGGSPRAYLKRQAVVLAGAAIACAAVLAIGLRRAAGIYAGAGAFHYPALATAEWLLVAAFALAVAAGWVIVPGAVLGLRALCAAPALRDRAFGFFSLFLLAGFCLEAAVFGANTEGGVLDRYTFYLVPLIAIACVWSLEVVRPERVAYAAVAYSSAAVAILLPATTAVRSGGLAQAPGLLGLSQLGLHLGSPALVWAPVLVVLAVLSAGYGVAHPHAVVAVAAAFCVGTSVGASYWHVRKARHTEVPRAHLPARAAFLTWAGSSPYDLEKALFWNRAVTRVVVLGQGDSPDGYAFVRARLASASGPVADDGANLPGTFVVGPDTVAVGAGQVPRGGPWLAIVPSRLSVIVFGWYRRIGYLASAGRIFAAARKDPLRLTMRMWSSQGTKTMYFGCDRGFSRRIEVTRRPASVTIPFPAGSPRACRFALIGGSVRTVAGYTVSVRGAMTVARGG